MITSTAQARRVQAARVQAGKKGVAKAVRKFHKRITASEYQSAVMNLSLVSDFSGCRTYNQTYGVGHVSSSQ